MKEFRVGLILFCVVYLVCVGVYFFAMTGGEVFSFSSSNQDWGGFGSFVGGVLSPASALLAGYLVYKTFSANSQQQKLLLVRTSLERLDDRIERKIDAAFMNNCFGPEYVGMPMRNLIVFVSNGDVECNDEFKSMMLSMIHNMSALFHAVVEYKKMLEKLPEGGSSDAWLWIVEHQYWIEKYGPICSRIEKIVGEDSLEKKLSEPQLVSLRFVCRGSS
ncbi:hypothetical protein [Halomonas cupida]|uniref:hypothetical protein n=1 Tax=Halomonas cupida TaxID=44933 RepID=UPI003A918900